MPICDKCKNHVDDFHIIWRHGTWFEHLMKNRDARLICFNCVGYYRDFDIVNTVSNGKTTFHADSRHPPLIISESISKTEVTNPE